MDVINSGKQSDQDGHDRSREEILQPADGIGVPPSKILVKSIWGKECDERNDDVIKGSQADKKVQEDKYIKIVHFLKSRYTYRTVSHSVIGKSGDKRNGCFETYERHGDGLNTHKDCSCQMKPFESLDLFVEISTIFWGCVFHENVMLKCVTVSIYVFESRIAITFIQFSAK